MKDKGKPKPRQKPRYGDPVDDTSFHNTTFGIRAPVRRRSPPRHGRKVKVKGSKRHVARRAPRVGSEGEEKFPWHVPR